MPWDDNLKPTYEFNFQVGTLTNNNQIPNTYTITP